MGSGVLVNLAALTMTAASVLTAGCSSSGSPSTAAQPEATVSAGTSHSTPAPTASTPARLTIAQARTAYRKISAPYNAAVATLNRDAHEGTTWSKFKADVLAVAAQDRIWKRKVQAVRWPRRVQPYVNVLVKTGVPAEIRCDRAMAAAGTLQGAATVFSDDSACKSTAPTADKIRKILNLSPAPG